MTDRPKIVQRADGGNLTLRGNQRQTGRQSNQMIEVDQVRQFGLEQVLKDLLQTLVYNCLAKRVGLFVIVDNPDNLDLVYNFGCGFIIRSSEIRLCGKKPLPGVLDEPGNGIIGPNKFLHHPLR